MLHLKLRRNIAGEVVERKKQTVAERFALVFAHLKLEYDLSLMFGPWPKRCCKP
jgi:hypothetical protein